MINYPPKIYGADIKVAGTFPKMQLSKEVEVTEEFRERFNEWLAGFFGYDCLVPQGEVIYDKINHVYYVHPANYEELKKALS